MVFLSWNRPTPQQQQSCITKSGEFNYDSHYMGATSNHVSQLQDHLATHAFHLNHARVLLGSGTHVFDKAKTGLHSWSFAVIPGLIGHLWTPKTPIERGVKFCVCAKQVIPSWLIMPLQVVYVDHTPKASLGFGSSTLNGHLLAGEERFSIELLDEKNQVWYEILSLSKPDHILSRIAYCNTV